MVLPSSTCSSLGLQKTFHDYATDVFVPYVTAQLQYVTRMNIVWDEYLPESLKADTRSKRGRWGG